ncbi:hypothetical protein BsWGS_00505 [Bradybaena similaris]
MYFISPAFFLCAYVTYARTQNTCDTVNRMCINGICELQANQQLACTCNPGFNPDPSNPLFCNPTPACNLIPGNPDLQCVNGQCLAQGAGTFTCVCYSGYQRNTNNFNVCDDIDECQTPSTGCVSGGCVNLPGDYFCTSCISGYSLDQGSKCQRNVPVSPPANQNVHPWLWMWMHDGFF